MPTPKRPFVAKRKPWVTMFVTVTVCVVVLGFVFFGILQMSRVVTGNWLSGRIEQKKFRPFAETRISFGSDGLKRRDSKGDFLFEVKVGTNGTIYSVFVDEPTYRSYQIGDRFEFPKPPASGE